MAKGKEALRSAQRRESAALEQAERLVEEIQGARREAVQVRRQLKSQRGLEIEVRRLREQVAAGTSDALAALQKDHDRLATDTRKLTERVRVMVGVHENAVACALSALGGGAPAMEKFIQILRGPDSPSLTLISNEHVSGLNIRTVRLIERKRRNQGDPKMMAAALAKLRGLFPGRKYLQDRPK